MRLPARPPETPAASDRAAAPAPAAAAPPPAPPDPAQQRSAAWLRAGLSPRQATGLEHAHQTGRLTNREYRDLHGELSDEAARLDLADLVERGYLLKIGSNRGTYYILRD